MRIAIFTETYLPTINGVVTHVKTLKEGLEALGHHVLIVTADASTKKHREQDGVIYCPAVVLKSIYGYGVASPISHERVRLIKQFNPDIIHIHNEFGIGISGIMISKSLKIPLVYTLHTMYDDYVYYVANKHFCKFVTNITHSYARILAGTSAAITGPSKKVEDFFVKCGVKKPINVIPNSVELDEFDRDKMNPEDTSALRKKLGFNDDDFVVGFCGRLGKEKNVTLLLENWAKTVKPDDRLKLMIIGEGPLYEQHVEETKKFGISDMVKMVGRIEHVDCPKYYAVCNAYVTASLSDTCSISMLEGMAMRLPVVHICDEQNAGQVVHGVNGYIYNNADEMYLYLTKMRDMPPEEFKAFGERTRQSIITSGAERLALSTLTIYEDVIQKDKLKKELRRSIKNSRKESRKQSDN